MNSPISPLRIVPVDTAAATVSLSGDVPGSSSGGGKFMETLQQSMNQVEDAQGGAATQVAQLLNGRGADLHSAMIAVEKADLSFQLMMQVRNKIVQAYQQIAGMQF
jgi:flagellar hook-basal body complex protein FliE